MKMRAVDLAEMLREVIEAKINRCKREIKDCTLIKGIMCTYNVGTLN
jgi:ribosome-associated translation inhibitor RaiA